MELAKAAAALEKRGYAVRTFAAAAQAADYLNGRIDGTSVGLGGSVTLRELGLYETLPAHNDFRSHWAPPAGMTPDEARRWAAGAAVYLSSVNGLAETGELVFIDGKSNRVSSVLYGHEKVFLVVGRNKLAPTCEEAIRRARNVAAPKNAVRLGVKTPCAAGGGTRCFDCASPERICCSLVVLWEKPRGSDTEILLIDEDLGY